MKKEQIKSPTKAAQHEDDCWVNVHDEALMIELGIHPPKAAPRDPSVWTKTPKEKRLLATMRRIHKGEMHFNMAPVKSIPVRAKLIIQLKKNRRFPHTTYSTTCWQHQIDNILSRYYEKNRKTGCMESVVSKYVYNGRTYKPDERPFWP